MGKGVRSTTSVQCNRSRRAAIQDSSAFQFIAIDTIHESTTNPRRTFDESKLHELAESIRANGLFQPITVRPNSQGFEIVAGARRYRAAQLAELFSVPARIVEIDDATALEWAITENALREDVHPYEEAQGYQRLLDMPGYDVATLVEKTGKSASHIYARLSVLQLIPTVAEAFTQERITASHANLIARLPKESQAAAFEQCWRKDWQDKEPHLLPAKHVAAWIQANLYLSLADAPFDREDPTLNPAAGACVTCPRRSGYNTALFADVGRINVSYVESGQPQVFSAGSPPRSPRETLVLSCLFSLDLHQEVHVPFDFTVHPIRWDRFPLAACDTHAHAWLSLQSHRGLSANTLDAYSRALERFLAFLMFSRVASVSATRADVGLYLASLQAGEVALANATIQQLLTVVRLFHGYLMEEGTRSNNPAAQTSSGRAMVARHHKLPWIPNEEDWHRILAAARQEPIRNRTMLAFAYDAGLRREELCSLQTSDIDPSRRLLKIRAESTKGRRERALPYSASSGELLVRYLEHRRTFGNKRGPLFLSESRRNYSEPISIWSWSKIVLQIARRAGVERFSTHTLRHLCLTDLAHAGWDIHEIATFAGHRSVQTTLLYIHLSGRDLSLKLAAGMAQIHARRVQMLAEVAQ